MSEVLDRNLERLLRRAYVPALPAPDFRARVTALARRETERRAAQRPGRARPRLVPFTLALAAAAALLFVLRPLLAPRALGVDELLAADQVALLAPPAGWRAATARELAEGVAPAGALTAATPAATALDLRLSAGRVRLAGGSRLAARPGGDAGVWSLRLDAGAVRLARPLAASAWELDAEAGRVLFDGGRLSARVTEEGLELRLAEGRARVPDARGGKPLTPGESVLLVDGALRVEGPSASAPVAPEREPLAPGAGVGGAPAGTASAAATSATTGRVIGTVALAADAPGAPPAELPAFRVGLLRHVSQNETTSADPRPASDSSGHFLADDVDFGTYDVFVVAEGYAVAHAGTVQIDADAPEARFEATLTRGGDARGFVVDAASGDPIQGAFVVSERDVPASGLPFDEAPDLGLWLPAATHSRADGSFELPHLSAGEHVLHVSAPGHAPAWTAPISVAEDGSTTGLTVELGAPASIAGTVTDVRGQPVAGAQLVAFFGEELPGQRTAFALATTASDGSYSFADLPAGFLLVGLITDPSAPDAAPRVLPATLAAGKEARVDFGGEHTGTRLSGHLHDRTGAPIVAQNLACFPRGEFRRSGDWVATSTDGAGAFAFEDLAPGPYLIYRVGRAGIPIQLVDELEVPAVPELAHEVTLAAPIVEGRITDAASGTPLPGSLIVLDRREDGLELFAGMTRAADDGSYRLAGLPPGRYALTAFPVDGQHGFEHEPDLELEASATEPVPLDFALYPGGAAAVLVVDDAGRPVPQAHVTLRDDLGEDFTFAEDPLTDDHGVYEAAGIRTGSYRVRAERDGFATSTVPFSCRAGVRSDVRIVLHPQPESSAEPSKRDDR